MSQTPLSVSSASYVLGESFEGTGFENANWTTGGSGNYTIDADSATSSHLDQSLYLCTYSGLSYASATNLSLPDNFQFYFRLRFEGSLNGSSIVAGYTNNVTGTLLFRVYGSTGEKLSVRSGSSGVVTATTALSPGTWYHVWVSHNKGSGSDSVTSIGFSEDGIRPTSGNSYAVQSNGNAIVTPTVLRFGNAAGTGNNSQTNYFDRVLISTNSIGNNP